MGSYGKTVTLKGNFDDVVAKVKEAFAGEGFGTLTEIDVRATLEAKLGARIERYLILGACNPQLAHRALDVTRDVGLLLPCNVVVREAGDDIVVQALDPAVIATVSGDKGLEPIAVEAGRRIDSALEALRAA